MLPITVLILTHNEAVNLPHCLASVTGWVQDIFVLDSGSTDATTAIAEAGGATVFHRSFDNYASQRNYAVQQLPINTDWVFFLDADEYVPNLLKRQFLQIDYETGRVNGYFISFKFIFLNQWIRHGGYYPTYILRLFRRSAMQQIDRVVDEQVQVLGEVAYLTEPFVHHDRKSVQFWYEKHVRYTRLQVIDLRKQTSEKKLSWSAVHTQRDRKRWLKEHVWSRVPVLFRPFLYFFYRYIFLFGFLDGKAGFIFHFSHAFLYQFMISAVYIDEKNRKSVNEFDTIKSTNPCAE